MKMKERARQKIPPNMRYEGVVRQRVCEVPDEPGVVGDEELGRGVLFLTFLRVGREREPGRAIVMVGNVGRMHR
jgi:hypothetical protein